MAGVDAGTVLTLRRAGWTAEQIVTEAGATPGTVARGLGARGSGPDSWTLPTLVKAVGGQTNARSGEPVASASVAAQAGVSHQGLQSHPAVLALFASRQTLSRHGSKPGAPAPAFSRSRARALRFCPPGLHGSQTIRSVSLPFARSRATAWGPSDRAPVRGGHTDREAVAVPIRLSRSAAAQRGHR